LRHSLLVVAALALAAPAAADEPDNKPDMVRPSRCPAMGRGVIMVMHYRGVGGDPNGSGGPWMSPPPPTPLAAEGPPPIPPQAAPLNTPLINTYWGLGATADFDGDWVCDLVWSRAGSLAITITDGQGSVPGFRAPTAADVFAEVEGGWTVLGSGDFVSVATLAPAPDDYADLVLWQPSTGALSIWAGDGDGGFPASRRYAVQGALPPGTHAMAIANLDGQGTPELVRMDGGTRFMVFHRLVGEAGELHLHDSTLLYPPDPLPVGWSLRVADDLDGDGNDDLVFQHDDSWQAVVWYMTGPWRREGYLFVPDRMLPPAHLTGFTRSPIIGPR
jgi:hypothetical protein